jgi:hypothetical protein
MRRVIFALATGLLSTQAFAADLPMPAPPPRAPAAYVPIAPPFTWSGIYVGGNLGAAWNRGTVSDALGTGFTLPSNNAVFTGGGQIGANYQFGAAVVGVEGMFDWLANQNNASAGITVTNVVTGLPNTVNVVSQNRWLTTATGKVGFAADHWLFYGKGGWAWVGNSNFSVNDVTTARPLAVEATRTTGGRWAEESSGLSRGRGQRGSNMITSGFPATASLFRLPRRFSQMMSSPPPIATSRWCCSA